MASNVVSLSGGKDSTAMLLMMLERGESIAAIVFFDTGWEFPQMHEHIDRLERFVGRKFIRLTPRDSFIYLFSQRARTRNKDCTTLGYGWPAPNRRWCTREKTRAIQAYCNALTWQGHEAPVVQCIGFAADESTRKEEHYAKNKIAYQDFRYPLIEYGMTEADCLDYCKKHGFKWDGLYNIFDRVSCFCCPLQSLDKLRKLRRFYPDLWHRMLEMDSWLPENDKGRRFNHAPSVAALEARFFTEDDFESRKIPLPGVVLPQNTPESLQLTG